MEGGEENPLLDSRFPDVSAKGRGYQLQSYPDGIEEWPELRRVTIWQTVAALEQEFRDRAARLAEAKAHTEASSSTVDTITDNVAEQHPRDETVLDDKPVDVALKISRTRHSMDDIPNVFDEDYDIAESKNLSPRSTHSSVSGLGQSKKGQGVPIQRAASTPDFNSSASPATPIASAKGGDERTPVKDMTASGRGSSKDDTSPSTPPSRFTTQRPHHIPKIESLSKKLDQIRHEMGDEVSVSLSPPYSFVYIIATHLMLSCFILLFLALLLLVVFNKILSLVCLHS